MTFKRFYNDSIAQASFLVGCAKTGEAVVIDPNRDLDTYIEAAEAEGLRIVAVTETHIHADYVSGSRELAHVTGATLYLSKEGGAGWQYGFDAALIGDGDTIRIGNVRLEVVHTPGHTPEHLSFVLIDGAATNEPVGVFTGDFIFAGDVGRPDLLEVAAGFRDTMRQGAETLYRSLSEFKHRPDRLILWPGHGAGSACGKALGNVPSTTLGYEKIANAALRFATENEFVDDILKGQPEPPKYFARMKSVNKAGPSFVRDKMRAVRAPAAAAFEPGVTVVDVRDGDEHLTGSIRGVLAIPFDKSFAKWAGSLISPEQEVVLIANDEEQALDAIKTLFIIGIEKAGHWIDAHSAISEAKRVERFDKLQALTPQDAVGFEILDVRGSSEREEDFIPGTLHVPLVNLTDAKGLPQKLAVHCAAGARALIAASYLTSKGVEALPIRASFADVKAALTPVRL